LSNVVAIAGGYYHSLALKADGTVIAWGNNSYGQTTVPAGLSNVVAIAGGYYHSLALKADGTVIAWGNNNYGQTTVPAGLSNVVAIAGGYLHSLALTVPFASTNTLPTPQLIRLLSVQFSGDGSARLQFGGGTNDLPAGGYTVLYADSLTPPVQWQTNLPVSTVTNGVLNFTDPTAGSSQQRFYRLRQ
jgi:hypothetical protein